jgi:hypothetical protein
MKELLKNKIKNLLILLMNNSLRKSHDIFDNLMAVAIQTKRGLASQNDLKNELEKYYNQISKNDLIKKIDYAAASQRLKDNPKGYKVDIYNYDSPCPSLWLRLKLWKNRLKLLRHYQIRSDLLILRKGEEIPPHAHKGIVSGFYLLEGKVTVRHYDIYEYNLDHVKAKKTFDKIIGPGEFTVNSDRYNNIHWLIGEDDVSILYRFNTTSLPSDLPEIENDLGRIYVNMKDKNTIEDSIVIPLSKPVNSDSLADV